MKKVCVFDEDEIVWKIRGLCLYENPIMKRIKFTSAEEESDTETCLPVTKRMRCTPKEEDELKTIFSGLPRCLMYEMMRGAVMKCKTNALKDECSVQVINRNQRDDHVVMKHIHLGGGTCVSVVDYDGRVVCSLDLAEKQQSPIFSSYDNGRGYFYMRLRNGYTHVVVNGSNQCIKKFIHTSSISGNKSLNTKDASFVVFHYREAYICSKQGRKWRSVQIFETREENEFITSIDVIGDSCVFTTIYGVYVKNGPGEVFYGFSDEQIVGDTSIRRDLKQIAVSLLDSSVVIYDTEKEEIIKELCPGSSKSLTIDDLYMFRTFSPVLTPSMFEENIKRLRGSQEAYAEKKYHHIVSYSPSGDFLALGDFSGHLTVYETKRYTLVCKTTFDEIYAVVWSPNSTRMMVVTKKDTVICIVKPDFFLYE